MIAVLPKPMLPTITTPRLVEGSLLRRQASTSWKSHSLPVKSQSDERPGISKWRGFRLREGVKETGEEKVKERYFCVLTKTVTCMLTKAPPGGFQRHVKSVFVSVYLCGPAGYGSQSSVWAFWAMFWKERASVAHPDKLGLQGGLN